MAWDDKRVHGGVSSGEFLSSDIQFFTCYTVCDMSEGDWGTSNSGKRNLDQFIRYVSTKAQPVMVSVASASVDLSVSANRTLYGLGTQFNQDDTTIWTVKFAVDKKNVWATSGADSDDLVAAIDGFALPYTTSAVPITGPSTENQTAFETSNSTKKNISITRYDVL